MSGLRYVFPGEPGKPVRGFRTAQDAPPLVELVVRAPTDLPLVWPHPEGDARGLSLTPLFPTVPAATRKDPKLLEWLALADALRTGDARVRSLAAAEVTKLVVALEYASVR